MAKKTATVQDTTPVKKPLGNIDHLRKILSVDTIVEDINQEEALEFLEAIETEQQELRDEVKELDEKVEEQDDADSIIKKLRDLSISNDQAKDLLEIISDDDPDHIYDFVRDEGYVYVKVDNILHQQKLRDFIEREIYPAYNDQQKYILF